ncbi:transposase family protein [Streptomyces bobili]|uniref:helix-turn-helix domain-containing protein n=1 Tax=Streptomyces bobili TaxID=67280 RepID=UPI0033AC2FB8
MIAELAAHIRPLWHKRHWAGLASRQRKQVAGVGAKHQLVFVDGLLATLVHLRHGAIHDVLACWFGGDRSTITRAIGEVRSLLTEAGVHHRLRHAAANLGRGCRPSGRDRWSRTRTAGCCSAARPGPEAAQT